MKITSATTLAGEGTATISRMSKAQQDQLVDLTVNEAIAAGLITDLGDDEGNFIVASGRDDVDAWYAIVNGKGIPVSSTVRDLMDTPEEVAKIVGKLTFGSGISNKPGEGFGKHWFNLGVPRGINVTTKGALKLALEPVGA